MQMEMKIWRKNLQRPTSTWEKMQRYQHSELCEVSDPEARMELHNGVSGLVLMSRSPLTIPDGSICLALVVGLQILMK